MVVPSASQQRSLSSIPTVRPGSTSTIPRFRALPKGSLAAARKAPCSSHQGQLVTQSRGHCTWDKPSHKHPQAQQPTASPVSRPRGQCCTCVDSFVAGKIPLVAEGGLAAVTLVGLVTVDLKRVSLERGLLGEPAVALVAEEGSVLWEGTEESNEMGNVRASSSMGYGMGLGWWREAARARVGTRNRVQTFVVSGACTAPLPPDLLAHSNNMHGLGEQSHHEPSLLQCDTSCFQEASISPGHLSERSTKAPKLSGIFQRMDAQLWSNL